MEYLSMKMEREVTIWSLIGDDDEKTKSKKSKVLYSVGSGIKELDIPVLDEQNNVGLQADILISLMGANFSYKRKSNDAGF